MQESCSKEAGQNSPFIQRPQKLLREKLQTSDGKFPTPKFLMLGRTTFLTFQSSRWTSVCSVASLVLMSLFNRSLLPAES